MASVAEQIPQKPTLSEIEQIASVILHIQEAVVTLEHFLKDDEFPRLSAGTNWFYQGQDVKKHD
ncbi:hypothetical protein NIES2107_08020 [Nostoc carneum NIES-2107]|nr:hypothetical protein NIES2107_08020 [Nostoc carneum NIES-2107]